MTTPRRQAPPSARAAAGALQKSELRLRLYIAGDSPNSLAAIRHLRAILSPYPELAKQLEVIDVLANPELGARDNVLVTPTMVKLSPAPVRRVIGNLKDTQAVLSVLGVAELEDG